MPIYSLAEIRNGTGFPKNASFQLVTEMTDREEMLVDALREAVSACELFADSNNTCANAVATARQVLTMYENCGHPAHEGVLMVGNVVDGFRFIGPFACESDAAAHAQAHLTGESWTTATMGRP